MKLKFFMYVVITLAVVMSGTIVANAQTGIKGGLSFANIDGDIPDEFDTETRTGLAFGLFHHMQMTETFGFRPELMYVQKGYSMDAEFFGMSVESEFKVDYIDIVLPAIMTINPQESLSPQVFAGPYAGFNISAEAESTVMDQTETEDISDDVASLDFGLTFGAGAMIEFGTGNLTLDVRYNLGLANIVDDDGLEDDFNDEFPNGMEDNGDEEIFNRGFMLTVGYQF